MVNKLNRIGILTFHCSNNYGAVLQAYALRYMLQKLHPSCEINIIDYRCQGTVTLTSFSDIRKKKGVIGAILHYRQINLMNDKFNSFRKHYLNLSKEYYSSDDLAHDIDEYDVIISGSDQVWNLKWSNGDTVYFQDFHNQNKKKYSYAASFGFTELDETQVEFYKKTLSAFSHISVREQSGLEMLQKQLELDAIINLDPTLLLKKTEWSEIAQKPQTKGKYILVYMVPKQNSVIQYALKLKKETGLQVVMLSKNFRPISVKHRGDSSPEEFVGWFENAEYVVTNSFHGTAFACIFEKKFWIDLNNDRGLNTRSKGLLELCGLKSRINDNGTAFVSADDWKSAHFELEHEVQKAVSYLAEIK